MRINHCLAVLIAGTCLVGCDKSSSSPPSPTVASASASTETAPASTALATATSRLPFPGTEEGAKALLEGFLKSDADRKTMTSSLRPDAADFDAIFTSDVVANARAAYDEKWKEEPVVEAREGQTELQMWKATTEQLRNGSGDASEFPSGYKKIADKLKPGLTFYRFKFVKPGDKHGNAFDGLVFVNGHWVMVSKPYRYL